MQKEKLKSQIPQRTNIIAFLYFLGKDLVAAPAERLKEAGIALFCIGVEPDSETPEEINTMKEELMTIASEPTKQHLFMSDGYHELQRKVQSISQAACVGTLFILIADKSR